MLRAVVTFLVGAGVMMGAFITGVAQRVPALLSHFDDQMSSEEVQPQGDSIVAPPQHDADRDVYQGTDVVPAGRDEELARDEYPRPAESYRDDVGQEPERSAMAFRVEGPQSGGCINTYRFINDTDRRITFQSDTGRVEVPPGGVASPDNGIASDQACGPALRIHAEQ